MGQEPNAPAEQRPDYPIGLTQDIVEYGKKDHGGDEGEGVDLERPLLGNLYGGRLADRYPDRGIVAGYGVTGSKVCFREVAAGARRCLSPPGEMLLPSRVGIGVVG
jgi:hypothetical protein